MREAETFVFEANELATFKLEMLKLLKFGEDIGESDRIGKALLLVDGQAG